MVSSDFLDDYTLTHRSPADPADVVARAMSSKRKRDQHADELVTPDPATVTNKTVGSELATSSDNHKRARPAPTPVHRIRDALDGDTLDDMETLSDDLLAIDHDTANQDSFDFDFLQEPSPSQPSSTQFSNTEPSAPLADSTNTSTPLMEASPQRPLPCPRTEASPQRPLPCPHTEASPQRPLPCPRTEASPRRPLPCPRTKAPHAKAPLAEVEQNVSGRRSNRTRVITEKAKALTAPISDEWLTEALQFFRGEDLGADWVKAVDQWEAIERERGPVWAPKPVVRAVSRLTCDCMTKNDPGTLHP
jgi:hypothetical protein